MHVGILRRNDLLKRLGALKTELVAGLQLGGGRIGFEIAPGVLRRQRDRVERAAPGDLHAHGDGIADGDRRRAGGGGHGEIADRAGEIRGLVLLRQRQRFHVDRIGRQRHLFCSP